MKILGGFMVAVIATYILGTVFVSQGNIAAVVGMGFDISFSQRLEAALHDFLNMYDLYLPLVTIGLAIGFGVAAPIIRYLLPDLRLVGYVLAGFTAMIALHVILKAVLGLSGIAPTRELTGLLLQGCAGAAGGYLFHLVTRQKTPG